MRRWTYEELSELVRLAKAGKTPEQISAVINRSYITVLEKMRAMNGIDLPTKGNRFGKISAADRYRAAVRRQLQALQADRDHDRLSGQLLAVFELMKDGRWRTLADISGQIAGSEASLSARLRDLRKEKYGSHIVKRERIEGGLFRYQLVLDHRTTDDASLPNGHPGLGD